MQNFRLVNFNNSKVVVLGNGIKKKECDYMKLLLPIIYIITFIIGIFFIITADTGLITSYYQALIAGVIISCFAGIFLAIYLHEWHKKN